MDNDRKCCGSCPYWKRRAEPNAHDEGECHYDEERIVRDPKRAWSITRRHECCGKFAQKA